MSRPQELTCLHLPVMGSQAHTTLLGFLIRFRELNGQPHAYTHTASCLYMDGLLFTHGQPHAYTKMASCLYMDGLMLIHGRPHVYTWMASRLHMDSLVLTHGWLHAYTWMASFLHMDGLMLPHGWPHASTQMASCLHMDGLMLTQQVLCPLIYLSAHIQGVLTDFVSFSCTDQRSHSHWNTDSESPKAQQCRVRDLAQCISCTSDHIRSCFSGALRR